MEQKRKPSLSSGARNFLIGMIFLILAACGVVVYLLYINTVHSVTPAPTETSQNQQSTTNLQGTSQPQDQSNSVAPTKVVEATSTLTPTQPVKVWPPQNDTRPVLKVAFPSFGSYFTAIEMYMMDNPNRPYRLEAIPLRVTGLDGTELNPGTEPIQAEKMAKGEWDLLFNTADVLAKNPNMGAWISDIDQSAGADKTVSWPLDRLSCLQGKDFNNLPKGPDGQPQLKFNLLKGCKIGVMAGSVGEYQVLSFMRLTAMTPQDITIIRFSTVKEAVAAYASKQLDAVAGWTPDINSALEAGGIPMLDSSWLRNINDIIIVSNQANVSKADLVQAFLADWFAALKLQQEDPTKAWEMIASWNYPNSNITDWTYVYPGSSLDDAKLWLSDQVAQAGLDSNLILAQNKDVLTERFNNAREVWAWSGSPMGEPFDATKLIETKYLQNLATNAASYRPTQGEFLNPTYAPFPATGSAPTPEQLISLPTVADFGCAEVEFGAGIVALDPGTEAFKNFVTCAASLKQLIIASDVQILITGSAAYPLSYTEAMSLNFAKRRAIGIENALVQAGIPLEKIAITWRAGTRSGDEAVLQADRWVRIEIKRGG